MIKSALKGCQKQCSRQCQTLASAVKPTSAVSTSKRITEFQSFQLSHGHLLSHDDGEQFSADVYGWKNDEFNSRDYNISDRSTSFGYVSSGWAKLYDHSSNLSFDLCKGMYFSFPNISRYTIEPVEINNGDDDEKSSGIINVDNNYHGIFTIGGPVEQTGRLNYIDGTNTNLIIPPILFGNPCLNILYLDPNLEQTPHTHPSFRSGFVINGEGKCNLPGINESHDFKPGTVFWIPEDLLHSFKSENNRLDIMTFHPDSEFGPSHGEHPMMNNTIFNDE